MAGGCRVSDVSGLGVAFLNCYETPKQMLKGTI